MTRINTETRRIDVSDGFVDEGQIAFDVRDSRGGTSIYSDVPLVELLAALSKIPGVMASYEKPKPRPSEVLGELGLGAIFDVKFEGITERYVKTGPDNYMNAELTYLTFSAEQFDNDNDGESVITIQNQGYKP